MGVPRAVLIASLVGLAQAAFHVPPRGSRPRRSLLSEVCTNKRGAAAGFAMAASKTSRVVIVPGNGLRTRNRSCRYKAFPLYVCMPVADCEFTRCALVLALVLALASTYSAGCTPITQCNWYSWLKRSLEKAGVCVAMEDMPDPYEAKQSIWLPFMRDVLKADESSIIVGHSSGAEAAMRYAEVCSLC